MQQTEVAGISIGFRENEVAAKICTNICEIGWKKVE